MFVVEQVSQASRQVKCASMLHAFDVISFVMVVLVGIVRHFRFEDVVVVVHTAR